MATIALPAIKRSPATLQYRVRNTRPKKFYEPRFSLDKEDRAKTLHAEWFRKTDPMMPAYPYGADVRYPEANEGLYGGMTIQSGNKISSGRNKGKTLRKWYPNVKMERIRSEALGQELTIPIAARVLRTIRKVGGLDQYLTGTKPARVKELGMLGWKLRWMVINSKSWKLHYQKQREMAGLRDTGSDQSPLDETFEQAWSDAQRREEFVERQGQKWDELREKDERFRRHFMQNVVSDRTNLKIPDLKTLSLHDPVALQLGTAEVTEVESPRLKDPANDVRR